MKKNKGIQHLEDLQPRDFIHAVTNLPNCNVTEKLDGANLIFGIDGDNRLFTSRESKSGSRVYDTKDYPHYDASADGFRSAHKALDHIYDTLSSILHPGDIVECEVLFGRQPNAIVYGENRIVFLKINDDPSSPKLAQLDNILSSTSADITSIVTSTEDGIHLDALSIQQTWFFSVVPVVTHLDITSNEKSKLEEYQEWLTLPSDYDSNTTNEDILNINLSKMSVAVRPTMVELRKRAQETSKKFKEDVKQSLVSRILHECTPTFQTESVTDSEDIGIEGVVISVPNNDITTKLVARENFTIINQFNFSVRNQITPSNVGGRQTFTTLPHVHFYDKMLRNISQDLLVPELSNLPAARRYFKRINGTSVLDVAKFTISHLTHDDSFTYCRQSVVECIDSALAELNDNLLSYKSDWSSYSHELTSGRVITYTDEIHQRNLLVFAKMRADLLRMKQLADQSTALHDIIIAVFEKPLNRLYPS